MHAKHKLGIERQSKAGTMQNVQGPHICGCELGKVFLDFETIKKEVA
jgi:hypothetical protein